MILELKTNKTHRLSFQYNQGLLTNSVIVALHFNSLDEHGILDSRAYWGNTLKFEVPLPYDDCSKISFLRADIVNK